MKKSIQDLLYKFRDLDPVQRAALAAALGAGVGGAGGAAIGKVTGVGAGKGAAIGAAGGAALSGAGSMAVPEIGLAERFIHNSVDGVERFGLPTAGAAAVVAGSVLGRGKLKMTGSAALRVMSKLARRGPKTAFTTVPRSAFIQEAAPFSMNPLRFTPDL